MTELLRQIEEYQPFDEVEAEEKKAFIQFLKAFGNDVYTRDNLVGHITPSCWIVNKSRDKVLMINHKTRNIWAWLGGHADGDRDLLNVAIKEAKEESGLENIKVLSDKIFDVSTVISMLHRKKGKPVNAHIHYNAAYLFEADENEELRVKEDEAKDIKWLRIGEVSSHVPNEADMILYNRMMKKAAEKRRLNI